MGTINLRTSLQSNSGRFRLLISLLVFSLPLGQMAFSNIILLLLFIQSLIAFRWKDWRLGFREPLWWTQAAFYLFLTASLLWADNVDYGLRQLETKTSFFLAPLFLLAGQELYPKNSRTWALKAFWWACLAAVFIALAYAAYRSFMAGGFYEESPFGRRYFFAYTHLATPLMHPGYLASYLAIGLFAAIELQHSETKKAQVWYYRISIVLFLGFMLMLQARINLLALFGVVVIAALYIAWKRKAYFWLALPLIPVLALGLFFSLASPELKERYFQLPNFEYDIEGSDFNSATYRLAEWKCASDVIAENFWFGTGIGDNQQALFESYRQNRFWEGVEKEYNAHNQYLETMIAGGFVGLLILLISIAYTMWRAWRQMDYLALCTLIFLVIAMLTESMFERIWGVLIFTIFIPFLLQQPKESDSNAY